MNVRRYLIIAAFALIVRVGSMLTMQFDDQSQIKKIELEVLLWSTCLDQLVIEDAQCFGSGDEIGAANIFKGAIPASWSDFKNAFNRAVNQKKNNTLDQSGIKSVTDAFSSFLKEMVDRGCFNEREVLAHLNIAMRNPALRGVRREINKYTEASYGWKKESALELMGDEWGSLLPENFELGAVRGEEWSGWIAAVLEKGNHGNDIELHMKELYGLISNLQLAQTEHMYTRFMNMVQCELLYFEDVWSEWLQKPRNQQMSDSNLKILDDAKDRLSETLSILVHLMSQKDAAIQTDPQVTELANQAPTIIDKIKQRRQAALDKIKSGGNFPSSIVSKHRKYLAIGALALAAAGIGVALYKHFKKSDADEAAEETVG